MSMLISAGAQSIIRIVLTKTILQGLYYLLLGKWK